jgi:hypothetical protein
MTPPNVPVTPYPASSVMMRRTLGAPGGGTVFGGQYGFDSTALRLISPPNWRGVGGKYFPSIVSVALGDPGGATVGFPSGPVLLMIMNSSTGECGV